MTINVTDPGEGPVGLLQQLICYDTTNPPGNEGECICPDPARQGMETATFRRHRSRPTQRRRGWRKKRRQIPRARSIRLPSAGFVMPWAGLGIQTYGFLPMNLPPEVDFIRTIHGADERTPVAALDFGTDAVYKVLERYGR